MRHIHFTRDFYLPESCRELPPFVPEGTDLAVYQYEQTNGSGRVQYGACVFAGKQSNPLWHVTFRSNEQRQSEIASAVVGRRAHLASVAEREAERKAYVHPYKPGDVFTTSWGYDQTNVNAYEVVEARGKVLVLREVELRTVDGSHVAPVAGKYCGDPIRVIVRGPSVKVENHYAHPWKGSPCYTTPEGYGH